MTTVNLTLKDVSKNAGIGYSLIRYYKTEFGDYFLPVETADSKYPLYEPQTVELVKTIKEGADKGYTGQQLKEYIHDKGFLPVGVVEKGVAEEAGSPQRSSANIVVSGQSSFEQNMQGIVVAYEQRQRSLVKTFQEHTDEVKAKDDIIDKKNARIEELEQRSSSLENTLRGEYEDKIRDLEKQVEKLKKSQKPFISFGGK